MAMRRMIRKKTGLKKVPIRRLQKRPSKNLIGVWRTERFSGCMYTPRGTPETPASLHHGEANSYLLLPHYISLRPLLPFLLRSLSFIYFFPSKLTKHRQEKPAMHTCPLPAKGEKKNGAKRRKKRGRRRFCPSVEKDSVLVI